MKDKDTSVLLQERGTDPWAILARKMGKKFFSKLQSNPLRKVQTYVCSNDGDVTMLSSGGDTEYISLAKMAIVMLVVMLINGM